MSAKSFFPQTRQSLLQRMQSQDSDAWGLFFELYAPVVFRLAKRQGLRAEAAEDVVAEVMRRFVVAFRNGFEHDAERGPFRAYLQTVVRHAIWRAKNRDQTLVTGVELEEPAAGDDDWDRIEREEQARLCWERLKQSGRVRDRDLQAFEAYALQGEPPKTVAQRYQLTVNRLYGVKHEVLRALAKVRREMEQSLEAGGEDK